MPIAHCWFWSFWKLFKPGFQNLAFHRQAMDTENLHEKGVTPWWCGLGQLKALEVQTWAARHHSLPLWRISPSKQELAKHHNHFQVPNSSICSRFRHNVFCLKLMHLQSCLSKTDPWSFMICDHWPLIHPSTFRAARPTVITEESLGPASLAAVSNSRLLSKIFYVKFLTCVPFCCCVMWHLNFRDPISVRDDKVKEEVKEKGFTKHKGGKPSPR